MAHKTYLNIVNDLAREAGVSGNASSVSAVTSQTGEAKRLVDWVRQAYSDIQNRHPQWRWMRSTFTVNTVASDDTYAGTDCTDSRLSAAVSRFRRWWPYAEDGSQNVKIYLTATGVSDEGYLSFLPWSHFRSIYKIGTQNNGRPAYFTIDPQNNLVLGPKPDAIYTVTGEYQLSPLNFSANGDTPEFPEHFDDIILYHAMMKYGRWHGALEVFEGGKMEGGRLMRQLEADQLPEILLGEPLA
jgi:hypothetical protein